MKIAVIQSSDLAREGRWDAPFHIALSELKVRVDQLKATVPAEDATKKLEAIPLADKAPLLVLARGTNPHLNAATIAKVQAEYPHLSLAMMEKNLSLAIARVSNRIRSDKALLEALLALQVDAGEDSQ